MVAIRENRLLLGNPGTGKSTLINCLSSKRVFQSGIAWGAGLTQEYQKHIVGDVAYMDTPGLADPKIIEKAAQAIKTALKQNGTYKLFFMVRLQAGRTVADDLITIERVLDAIALKDVAFSVLVNNLPPRQYEKMTQFGPEYEQVVALINKGKYQTPYIFFIPKFPQLDEADNSIIPLPPQVIEFIENRAPSVVINDAAVSDINIEDFAKEAQELKTELEKLKDSHEELQNMMNRLRQRFRQELEREREFHLRSMEYHRQFYDRAHLEPIKESRVDIEDPPFLYQRVEPVYFPLHPRRRHCPFPCIIM